MAGALRNTSIAGVLCALTVAVLGGTAHAGSYAVWSCRGPAGEPLPATAWEPRGDAADTCATGGALTARAGGGLALRAPAGAAIAGYRVWRSARTDGDGWGPWWHAGAALLVDGVPASWCAVRCGEVADPLAAANLVTGTGLRAARLDAVVWCRAPGRRDCDGTELRLYRSAVALRDDAPPARAGAARVGAGSIAVPATDAGAGLRSAELRVDGRATARVDVPGCAEPYTRPAPCPAAATPTLPLDLAPGTHRVEVVAADAAGNAATIDARTVTVPATTGEVGGTEAVGGARIRLDRRRVPAGARRAVRGRVLVGRHGLAGARLQVQRRGFGPRGGRWRAAGAIVAGASGRFRLRVPAAATELRLRLVAPRPVRPVRSRALAVVSRLSLRARIRPPRLRNGDAMRLSGRLRGSAGAALGVPVEIQVMAGGRWRTVARVQADRTGRFAWDYRFRNTRLEALYSFRARVAGAARWPWRAATSPRVRVHVLP